MQTSYIIKCDHLMTKEVFEKIIEEYEESLRFEKLFVVDKDMELYKNEDGVYVKIF